ncbi:uncharacterized protein L969DRAFT_92383 [Mixia osmundae IAM 14324]|uniref:Ubiquitin-like domain-containing protein n=1 Tax=Mixia osmundae (strain CBS 9802 / IAM 14324 / JCM 22182 / KY 12970) TaxID=764103 RepID=G7DXQ0_MIXOS|nr:uncharacterized protein L969DRAFT_92383 [Mixia osmundae IAM 14324]KEI41150.1 hypothetical protein L969DRAFT_92383 [Mixia osmundae IAM 14324]GAA95360.1 hypothetical protein E5Q_02017 [Mixia osmundae IAM 14324]
MSDTEPQPKPEGGSEHINIKVTDSGGQETHFKIKMATKLTKLMTAYADRQGAAANSVRFLYDGRRLTGNETPQELDMEDGDTIECHIEQVAGWLVDRLCERLWSHYIAFRSAFCSSIRRHQTLLSFSSMQSVYVAFVASSD